MERREASYAVSFARSKESTNAVFAEEQYAMNMRDCGLIAHHA